MNNFTKEELETLLDVFHYAKDSPCWTKYHDEPSLVKKIQSLIDSYCEPCDHSWHSIQEPLPLASFNPEIHVTDNKISCIKCGISYE